MEFSSLPNRVNGVGQVNIQIPGFPQHSNLSERPPEERGRPVPASVLKREDLARSHLLKPGVQGE